MRLVPSEAELRSVYERLTDGGVPTEWSGYKGTVVRRPDGVEVGIRSESGTGGPTIDIRRPGHPRPERVHIE